MLWLGTAVALLSASNTPAAVTFHLALARQRPEVLAEVVKAVSDPSNTTGRFRSYLSDAEIATILRPTGLASVEAWIYEHAPNATVARLAHGSGQVLRVSAPAAEVLALLGEQRPTTISACSIPGHVASHLTAILGLHAARATTRPTALAPERCDFKGDFIDPDILAALYEWPAPSSGSGIISQGVAAFEDAEFKPSDVAAFEAAYHLPNVTMNIKGPNDGGYFGEASLDTQYIAASGAGLPSWFLSQQAFDLATWCEMVLTVRPLPTVWSISWGGGESNYPLEHQQAADDCFARAALQGVSIFAASGDDGTGMQGVRCPAFDPTYPSSLPHVTSVGATYLENATETGWASSGGGYSALWPQPSWQRKAVEEYERTAGSSGLPPTSLYNSSGRVTPDVAAVGTCFRVFSGGAMGTLSGTSAATPTFAGMVARVNDLLATQGKPPVGFINPILYAAGSSPGTDVVAGNNRQRACPAGFPATAGFDAVTGLGTPLWGVLKGILEA